jgi:hypothetical protein
MIVGRYAPGRRQAVVTDHGVVVVGADVPLALLERVWLQAAAGRGLPAVLEALTGAFGTSLAAIPPFAVALQETTGVRVVVRGALEIDVETGTGTESLSGVGVTTWTERSLPGVRRVSIVDGADGGAAEYPICDGIVLVSAIRVDFGDQADSVGPASASSVAPSVPAAPYIAPVAPVPVPEVSEAAVPPQATGDDTVPPAPVDSVPGVETVPALPDDDGDADVETAVAESEDAAAPSAPSLIDSATVLTATGADTLLPGDSTFARASSATTDEDEASVVDNELAATIARPAPAPTEGDHDGATISVAEARRLRGGVSDSAPPPLAPPRPPAPGRVRLSTGQVLLLDRTVVIGRRPRSTRVVGTDLPHLVSVASPEQDISRSHVELRAEGDSIVATDLHTTNGTTLHRPGADPVRLHPGEATVVVAGDLLDLGDGVTVAIEDLG